MDARLISIQRLDVQHPLVVGDAGLGAVAEQAVPRRQGVHAEHPNNVAEGGLVPEDVAPRLTPFARGRSGVEESVLVARRVDAKKINKTERGFC
jgi:hypothetical protein